MNRGSARAKERLSRQDGVALILTSLALVVMMGITAIVIDIGNANQRGRSSQSTTDASAIAGGWDLPSAATARTTAASYVADNLAESLPAPGTCPVGDSITADTVCYELDQKEVWITTPWDSSDYLIRVEICEAVDTSGTIGGDGASGCLGETTLLGGSVVAKNVLVKSDGTLSINAFSGGAAAGGGTWVRFTSNRYGQSTVIVASISHGPPSSAL